MRFSTLAPIGAFVSIVGLSACGGGYKAPTTPSGSPPPSTSASVTILGNRGNQSFTPNPGPATDGNGLLPEHGRRGAPYHGERQGRSTPATSRRVRRRRRWRWRQRA